MCVWNITERIYTKFMDDLRGGIECLRTRDVVHDERSKRPLVVHLRCSKRWQSRTAKNLLYITKFDDIAEVILLASSVEDSVKHVVAPANNLESCALAHKPCKEVAIAEASRDCRVAP